MNSENFANKLLSTVEKTDEELKVNCCELLKKNLSGVEKFGECWGSFLTFVLCLLGISLILQQSMQADKMWTSELVRGLQIFIRSFFCWNFTKSRITSY